VSFGVGRGAGRPGAAAGSSVGCGRWAGPLLQLSRLAEPQDENDLLGGYTPPRTTADRCRTPAGRGASAPASRPAAHWSAAVRRSVVWRRRARVLLGGAGIDRLSPDGNNVATSFVECVRMATATHCPYCSLQCGITLEARPGPVWLLSGSVGAGGCNSPRLPGDSACARAASPRW
jgi:hypothetical protein